NNVAVAITLGECIAAPSRCDLENALRFFRCFEYRVAKLMTTPSCSRGTEHRGRGSLDFHVAERLQAGAHRSHAGNQTGHRKRIALERANTFGEVHQPTAFGVDRPAAPREI